MVELKRYDYAIQSLLPQLWLRGFDFAERDRSPVTGDLVMLQSAPNTEWHLSWYLEDQGSDRHLLESLKTGKLCNWSNVGFVIMKREWVSEHQRIKWTDKQFAFERVFQAEVRKADFYIHLPYIDRFEGDRAFITFRVRFGLSKTLTPAEPFNIDSATRADLRCHLWKHLAIHQRQDAAETAARKVASTPPPLSTPSMKGGE